MGAPQYEQAGADIGGTGTPNTIPRWTGPSTLGNSGLIDDGTQVYTTTRNVGIGTASPGALLHLSSAATTLRVTSTTATNAGIVRIEAAGGNVYVGRDSSAGGFSGVASSSCFIDSLANPIVLGTSSSERMRISGSAAQVAIGTGSFTSGCSLTVAQSIDVSQSAQGLKLPATPGNADTQTLDCYQENTWTPTIAGFGGTQPTATSARYTRIGRVVYCNVVLDPTGGAVFDSTYGTATITAPFSAGTNAAVPANSAAISGVGAQGGTTVFLPTFASSNNAINVTWFFTI